MLSKNVLIFQSLVFGGTLLASHNWASEPPQGGGFEFDWKIACPSMPPRLVVAGTVNRFRKPTDGEFGVICSSPHARTSIVIRSLKVDKASLILRRGQDGRFNQVDLADLFQGDAHDKFIASVAPLEDPKDHAQLVYWLMVEPRNAKNPVPEEVIDESARFLPTSPIWSRLVVAGSVNRLGKQTNGTLSVLCSPPLPRHGNTLRNIKVDKASLILRRGQDGRYSQVDLADIFQGDAPDKIVASIAPLEDPKDHAQLVYWLIVKPQNARSPVLEEVIEETSRLAPRSPSTPAAPAEPKAQPSP